jgi:hypothetical protein
VKPKKLGPHNWRKSTRLGTDSCVIITLVGVAQRVFMDVLSLQFYWTCVGTARYQKAHLPLRIGGNLNLHTTCHYTKSNTIVTQVGEVHGGSIKVSRLWFHLDPTDMGVVPYKTKNLSSQKLKSLRSMKQVDLVELWGLLTRPFDLLHTVGGFRLSILCLGKLTTIPSTMTTRGFGPHCRHSIRASICYNWMKAKYIATNMFKVQSWTADSSKYMCS